MKKQPTIIPLLSALSLILLLGTALAQVPGTKKQEGLDLNGVWRTAKGKKVQIKQEGQTVQTVQASFLSGGECPYGGSRSYFFKGGLKGNLLSGTMKECTREERLIKCRDNPVASVFETVFEAHATNNRIHGKFLSPGYIGGSDDAGNPINCRPNPSDDKNLDFTLTRSCSNCGDEEARKLWGGLLAGMLGPTPTRAQEAISRFQQNCEGEKLLKDLMNMPCPWEDAPAGCKMGSWFKFQLEFQDSAAHPASHAEAGHFEPGKPFLDPYAPGTDPTAAKNFVYTVTITNAQDSAPGSFHSFPSEQQKCFDYKFSDGSSEMAATIYHELLHIWYVNKYQTTETGHTTDVENCAAYEDVFREKLNGFYGAMDDLEKCIKENQ